MKKLFDMVRPRYEEACRIRDEKNKENGNVKRGVGISIGIYCCADAGHDTCDVGAELLEDGKIAFYHTWEDHGQGADIGALASAHEALKPLNVKPEDIVMISNDTVHGIDSGYAAGSRSQIMVGNAIYAAANLLMDAMRKEDGSYRSYDEMKKEGLETFYIGNHCIDSKVTPFNKETMQFDPYIAYMYNATISEVDVDLTTGKTKVARMTAAYDVGRMANETVVKGQAYGGMMMCIGMALSEEFEDFKEQNTLAKCGFPTIDVIPDDIDLMFLQTPRENSFFGCSGCGEVVTAGVHPAVTNAIANATGARLYAMPAYPERVLKAIKQQENG
jgi:aldehyde oxidoreductase